MLSLVFLSASDFNPEKLEELKGRSLAVYKRTHADAIAKYEESRLEEARKASAAKPKPGPKRTAGKPSGGGADAEEVGRLKGLLEAAEKRSEMASAERMKLQESITNMRNDLKELGDVYNDTDAWDADSNAQDTKLNAEIEKMIGYLEEAEEEAEEEDVGGTTSSISSKKR